LVQRRRLALANLAKLIEPNQFGKSRLDQRRRLRAVERALDVVHDALRVGPRKAAARDLQHDNGHVGAPSAPELKQTIRPPEYVLGGEEHEGIAAQ